MKILIIIIHPYIETSLINKRWIKELEKYPESYTIHNLHNLYPDEKIDIEKEQQLLETYDTIVFQYPFYWFNCPPLFKKWLDLVLTHGWAYGRGSGYKLQNKKIALSISAGVLEKDLNENGKYKYTMKQLTAPFELSFEYIKADYKSMFVFYGAEHNPTDAVIEKSAQDYITFLNNIL